MGKVGLDGHTRGVKDIARLLRDNGFDVIYSGLRNSPLQIVNTAIQEDVSAIGLSFLSGAHLSLTKEVMVLLKEKFADDILVFCGGTIPPGDIILLKGMGVAEVFSTGTSHKVIIEKITAFLGEKSDESE